MRILIVEDERPTAEDIKWLVGQILQKQAVSIHIETTFESARMYMQEKLIDVLLLDLNLHAKDGFGLLQQAASQAFHTIVISANTDRAIEAFEYGVLDFIPKPYSQSRLQLAFDRLQQSHASDGHAIKYLSVKTGSEIKIIPLEQVRYFKSANVYTELHLEDGRVGIYDKPFKQLMPLLPAGYIRIHKSFLINANRIDSLQIQSGGNYHVLLKTGERLPVSRKVFQKLKDFTS